MDRVSEDFGKPDVMPEIREVEQMAQILRGEVSAMEAYTQVMQKVKNGAESHRLEEFLNDHRKAVTYWKSQVEKMNVDIPFSSGPWGDVVEAFVGSAKILGNRIALKALQEGEEHGLEEYKDALENPDLSIEHKKNIKEIFIPNQERHITSISAMMKMQ